MKAFVISGSVDTVTGMRLAGFEGEVLSERDSILKRLKALIADPGIAVVLLTSDVIGEVADVVSHAKLTLARPLIVEIPDREGTAAIGETINRYVSEAIGIQL